MSTATSLRLDLGVIATLEFGLFPSHWDIRPLGRCARFVGGMTPSRDVADYWGDGLPWVSPKDMKQPIISGAEESITAQAARETGIPIVAPGAVLIVVRGMILARTTPIAVTKVPVTINQDMKAMIPVDDVDPNFLHYALQARQDEIASIIGEAGHGTKRLPIYPLRNLNIPVPPLDEQRLIARYLDHHGRKVNAFIRAKRRLIDLLTEQKQAIIHQAVTRGLDTTVALKPSSIDWLGDVPAHWEVQPLKRSALGCIAGLWGDEPDSVNDFPVVRVADFDRFNLAVKPAVPTLRSIPPKDRFGRTLELGDLLLEKSGGGDNQLVGAVMRYTNETAAVSSNFVARLRPAAHFDSKYLTFIHACLYSLRVNFRSIKQTTGIQNLDTSAYLAERIPIPALVEQAAIVKVLERRISEITRSIENARNHNKLVVEYRTRLIADVVSGKLDVRAAAAALPEIVDDDIELIDDLTDGFGPDEDEGDVTDDHGEDLAS